MAAPPPQETATAPSLPAPLKALESCRPISLAERSGMKSAWVLVTNGDQESAQKEALLGPGPLVAPESRLVRRYCSSSGSAGLSSWRCPPLCHSHSSSRKKERGPGQEGQEMSGVGLCWATWPGTPGRGPASWRGRRLPFCTENGRGWERAGEGPELGP